MDLNIFSDKKGASAFNKYSNSESLRIMYAIGWANNFEIAHHGIELNKSVNTDGWDEPQEYYNGEIDNNINFNIVRSVRSLGAVRVDINKTGEKLSREILLTMNEAKNVLEQVLSKSNIFIISSKLARDIINNDKLYNTLKIDEAKQKGDLFIGLGTILDCTTYINLNDDTQRILAINTDDLSNTTGYITMYVKY